MSKERPSPPQFHMLPDRIVAPLQLAPAKALLRALCDDALSKYKELSIKLLSIMVYAQVHRATNAMPTQKYCLHVGIAFVGWCTCFNCHGCFITGGLWLRRQKHGG